nr:hypothetical protein [Tanacetum cinerariifolium]
MLLGITYYCCSKLMLLGMTYHCQLKVNAARHNLLLLGSILMLLRVLYINTMITSIKDEAVYKELDESLVRAATTASSLEAKQDSGNINKTQSKATPNESSSQGTDSGGGPRCQDTMEDTIAQTCLRECLNFPMIHYSQEGRISAIDVDEGITLVSTHDYAKMFDADQYLGGKEVFVVKQYENVVEKEVDAAQVQVSTSATTATISIDELLEKRRKFFAAKRAKEKRNKPPTQAQQRKIMCTYLKNVEGKKLMDLKNKSFDSIQKMFNKAFKRVNTLVDFRTELVKESSKKAEAEVMEQESSKREGTELEQ